MEQPADILLTIRAMVKLYEGLAGQVCERYQLSQLEANIIIFLDINPERNTVGDIAELRRLSKGNVSCAADNLIRRSLLRREQDSRGRRRVHLYLMPDAAPIVQEIRQMREQFRQQVFDGFTAEETTQFFDFTNRILENVSRPPAEQRPRL